MARVKRGRSEEIDENLLNDIWFDVDAQKILKTNIESRGIEPIIENWQRSRSTLYGKNGIDNSHICSFEGCKNFIERIDEKNALYGCNESGKYHQCFVDERCKAVVINDDGVMVCVFSGFTIRSITESNLYKKPDKNRENYFGDLDDDDGGNGQCSGDEEFNDLFGKDTKETKSSQKRFDISNVNRDKDQIRGILRDVLFNSEARKKINQKKESTFRKNAEDAIPKYYKECRKKKVKPSLITGLLMYDHAYERHLCPIVPQNEETMEKYVDKILSLWRVILRTPYFEKSQAIFHLKQHVIATLHLIMNGYIVKVDDDRTSLIIFESDKFLKENMPQGEDLEKIKYSSSSNNQKTYSRKDITKGVKNIQNSINSVLPTLKGLLIEEGLLDGR
jgi:hypothetical protein